MSSTDIITYMHACNDILYIYISGLICAIIHTYLLARIIAYTPNRPMLMHS